MPVIVLITMEEPNLSTKKEESNEEKSMFEV